MRVRLVRLRRVAWSRVPVATVLTPVGGTEVPWHGPADAAPGPHDVVWMVDTELTWLVDARPAEVPAAAVVDTGQRTVLCGLLDIAVDGACNLAVAGSLIQVDFTDPPPAELAGAWVEVHVPIGDLGVLPVLAVSR